MYTYIYNASALKRITANHLGYKVYQPLKFEVRYYCGAMLNKVLLRHVTSRHVTSRHVTLNLFWYTKTGPPSVLRTYHGGILVYENRTPIGTSYLSCGNLFL